MSNLMRDAFAPCACFGPTMLALGSLMPNRDGMPFGLIVTIPGALMTSAALMILFRNIRSLKASTTSPERSSIRD